MYKNILLIGAPRVGKTTLSRKLNKEFGYNLINLDNIVYSLEQNYPDLIKESDNDIEKSIKLAPFLITYLNELADGPNFYDGIKYVIEGVTIDFEKIMPVIDKNKYIVIGLTYNLITPEDLYNNMKKYDTEDDWTYYCDDNDLLNNAKLFVESNKYFDNKFKEYNIKSYDINNNREEVINKIIDDLKKGEDNND